jgi:hypothetical protein
MTAVSKPKSSEPREASRALRINRPLPPPASGSGSPFRFWGALVAMNPPTLHKPPGLEQAFQLA